MSSDLVLEIGLPVRYYVPPKDVRMDLLVPSDTWTQCLYKGDASYWSAEVGSGRVEDVAWSYLEPRQDAQRVTDHLCFLGASGSNLRSTASSKSFDHSASRADTEPPTIAYWIPCAY